MAWVRLDDKAMTHPKIVGLSDKAFRLWVWGLAYCQQHLTNGFIPVAAVTIAQIKTALELVKAMLWEPNDTGWLVHDYLDWNDSRELVAQKRLEAKARMALARERRSRELRVGALERTSPEVPLGFGSSSVSSVSSGSLERKDPPDSRSKRPIFTGQRLTVFEWQLDDCARTLGEFTDAFDLHEWFYALDAQAVSQGLVIPKRDGGEWLQSQLVAEAQRRGLPLRMAAPAQVGKLTSRMAAMVVNARRHEKGR